MLSRNFWKGRKVFITGHTGFKGSWLCLWLHSLGAEVTGYSLQPPTDPSLFELCGIKKNVESLTGDVRDREGLATALLETSPDVVIHMAAQPLVRDSYKKPVETFQTNIIGTVNVLEAVRDCKSVRAVINVTTDKCYENRELERGYREEDPLGGYDPYSGSKACSEMVTASYRDSFFNPDRYDEHGVGVATARSGNVIGGGDWATDRLVPDCIRSVLNAEKIVIRNPGSIRPWQHVLDPLCGYMMLAQRLYEDGPAYSGAWNFGPAPGDFRTVEWIVRNICDKWGGGTAYITDSGNHPHESACLRLDCSKAAARIGWRPVWDIGKAIDKVLEWTSAYAEKRDVRQVCLEQIREFSSFGS